MNDFHLTRRQAIVVAAMTATTTSFAGAATAADAGTKPAESAIPNLVGDERIVIVLYPGFTALDALGPHHVFTNLSGAKVQLVAKTKDPVETDTRYSITPQATYADVKEPCTLVLVPGGTNGTLKACEDAELRDFLRTQAKTAKLIGSVCTGSLILAAAGLLRGYRATCHWLALQSLAIAGAKPVSERVVMDRDRVTAAGVSAGIDLGLGLVKQWRGDPYAKGVQLMMEYDPKPPFDSGTPSRPQADPAVVKMLTDMYAPFSVKADEILRRAVK